jgi:hypothetical protein
MAYPPDHGIYTNAGFRLVLVLVGVSLLGYTVGPPLYSRSKGNSTAQDSCPSCVCDCSPEDLFSVPLGEVQFSLLVTNFLNIVKLVVHLHIYF